MNKLISIKNKLTSKAFLHLGSRMLALMALLLCVKTATARQTFNFNSNWTIDKSGKTVTLPHAWNEDDALRLSTYDMKTDVVWYRKKFRLPAQTAGKRVFIEFE